MARHLSLAVLLYHHVGPVREQSCRGLTVTPEAFSRQIGTMAAMGYSAILPDSWIAYVRGEGDIPERCVMITFDDAYADLDEHALPVLERKGFPATVFVPTSLVGKTINCSPADTNAMLPIMSEAQIQRWVAKGMTVGAHSRTHCDLTTVSASAAEDEITGSKADVSRMTGRAVTAFAYPYGKLNAEIEARVRSTYDIAFTVNEGLNDSSTPLSAMNRTMIQHADTIVDVLLRARYGKSVFQKIRQTVTARG